MKYSLQSLIELVYLCVNGDVLRPLQPQFERLLRVQGRDPGPIEGALDQHLAPVVADSSKGKQRVSAVPQVRRNFE